MIFTGPLSAFETVMEKHRPSHVISLLSPDMMMDADERLDTGAHLRLSLNDITSEKTGLVAPKVEHMTRLTQFIEIWGRINPTQKGPLFIHCYAGVSRSPAASYTALCMLNPDVDESNLARALRSVNRAATPNPMMIKLADDLLGREGRMVAAIEQIGRGENAWEGEVFPLPPHFPAPHMSGRSSNE